ncbi:MAG: DUF5666 domain-containing protein [Acidimicrobiales bacterium]|jgi:hypothetical protein
MPESDIGDIVTGDPPTEQLHPNDTAQVPVTPSTDLGASTELDTLFADEDDAWPTQGPKKGFRISWPVAALLVVLVASAGIWGGAYMQRHTSTTTSAASLFGGAFRRGGAGGGTGAGGAFASAAAANATAGTVTDIIGNTLYVTNASGNLVSVTIGSNTTINRNAKSTLSALQPGDTVTVQGTKSADGTVAAATVSATQAGVTTGFGGFGGFGRGGAGSAG